MNINPNIWGADTWHFLHYVTIAYPVTPSDRIKQHARNLFESLEYLLPCEKCRYNFGQHMQQRPLTDAILSSKTLLIRWLIDIHNDVNMTLGKSPMSYENAINTYMEGGGKWYNNSRYITILVTSLLLVALILFLRFK